MPIAVASLSIWHFEREVERGDAEAAHGVAGVRLVNTQYTSAETFGIGVGPGNVRGALDDGVARQARIGAAVEIRRDLAGDDPPVAHDAVLDVDALAAARRAELHFLVPAQPMAHGRAGQSRGENGERFGQGVDLAAEAAADGAADEMQLVRLHRR